MEVLGYTRLIASLSRWCSLDRPLPRVVSLLVLVVASILPTTYVILQYDRQTEFTSLILFGKVFQERALPEIREMKPALDPMYGYDGQSYAQIALDPLLRRPELRRLDGPAYRAQCIFLPTVAHLVGLGRPSVVVNIYAVSNLIFWFLLLAGWVRFLKPTTLRDYLCLLATVWSTGCLISIVRSLVDLPATTLGFYALALGDASGVVLISLAILTKPDYGLFLLKYAWPLPRNGASSAGRLANVALALALPLLWQRHIFATFGNAAVTGGNIGVPFCAWWECVERAGRIVLSPEPVDVIQYFEFLAPLSLMVQVSYFVWSRNITSPYWRVGAGFALLFLSFTWIVFAEQIAFCRCAFPMTLAFNVLLAREKGRTFPFFFLAGNFGLVWGAGDMVGSFFP